MGGTTKVRLDGNFSVRDGGEEGRSLPQRGRGPLGTIGSLAIQGINMLDTSPARGNAFVTPGNILVPVSLFLSFSLFSILFPRLAFLINFIFPYEFQYKVIFFTIFLTLVPRNLQRIRGIFQNILYACSEKIIIVFYY